MNRPPDLQRGAEPTSTGSSQQSPSTAIVPMKRGWCGSPALCHVSKYTISYLSQSHRLPSGPISNWRIHGMSHNTQLPSSPWKDWIQWMKFPWFSSNFCVITRAAPALEALAILQSLPAPQQPVTLMQAVAWTWTVSCPQAVPKTSQRSPLCIQYKQKRRCYFPLMLSSGSFWGLLPDF